MSVIEEIDALGGIVGALELGVPQRWIAESAYRYELDVTSGARPKVGVNVYTEGSGNPTPPHLFEAGGDDGVAQIVRTKEHRARRDPIRHTEALAQLMATTANGDNVMPPLIQAARDGVTVGEMADVFRAQFGEFAEPVLW